jgi:hypothetical protein
MGFLALEGYGGGPIDVIDIPDGRIVCRYGCDVPRRYPENDDLPPPPTAGCVTSVFDRDGHPILKDWNAESAPSRSETWTPAQFGRPLAANALAVGVRGAYWHGDSKGDVVNLSGDGTLVVSLESGHVFCLKLYHGDKRISLAELPLPTEQREEPSLREPGGTQALRFR